MGGFDPKRWMKLINNSGQLSAIVSKVVLKKYGSRELEQITAFISKDKGTSKWIALSKKHIIIIKVSNFKLIAGKGESEFEAEHGPSVMQLADYGGFDNPTTQDIIDFFNFKVSEEQIVEFST